MELGDGCLALTQTLYLHDPCAKPAPPSTPQSTQSAATETEITSHSAEMHLPGKRIPASSADQNNINNFLSLLQPTGTISHHSPSHPRSPFTTSPLIHAQSIPQQPLAALGRVISFVFLRNSLVLISLFVLNFTFPCLPQPLISQCDFSGISLPFLPSHLHFGCLGCHLADTLLLSTVHNSYKEQNRELVFVFS